MWTGVRRNRILCSKLREREREMIENKQNGNFEELLTDFKTKYYIGKCKKPLEKKKK
jgi:hypothetical protein